MIPFEKIATVRRRRLSFSMRSMLIVVSFIAIVCALIKLFDLSKPNEPAWLQVVRPFPKKVGTWVQESTTRYVGDDQAQVYCNEETGERVAVVLLRGNYRGVMNHAWEDYTFGRKNSYELLERPLLHCLSYLTEIHVRRALLNDRTNGQRVCGYWSWRCDGEWRAPASPRTEFRDNGEFSKLIALFDVSEEPTDEITSRQLDFVEQFLYDVNPTLDKSPALRKLQELTY